MSIDTLHDVELVFWNLPSGDHPSTQRVRDALTLHGFDADRAQPIPETTAFRRACDSLRDKSTLVRPFTVKEDTYVQIDREGKDDSGKALHRQKVGVYALSGAVVGPVNGADLDYLGKLRSAYETSLITYLWSDVSKTIAEIFAKDGAGIHSPRKGGAVYFAPVTGRDLLNRVEQFCASLDVRFLRYIVPDTGSQRAEVSEAVHGSLSLDLDAHQTAIAGYSETTKGGVLDNRNEAIAATESLVSRLRGLLLPQASEDIANRIHTLRADMDKARVKVDAHNATQPRGRRVVLNQPQQAQLVS